MKHLVFIWLGILSVQCMQAQSTTQICKPKLSVYFPFDGYKLSPDAQKELAGLCDALNGQEVMVELIAHTDDKGTDDYNFKLSQQRATSVEHFLRNREVRLKELNLLCKGESEPKYDNTNEQNCALNRRVDLVIFPMQDGKIVLTGNQGTQFMLSSNFFGPCSICESETEVEEVLTAEAAESMGLPLLTTDGIELITGGMFRLKRNCDQANDSDCASAVVRLPNGGADDGGMNIWVSVIDENGDLRWVETERKCGWEEFYNEITIDCLDGEMLAGSTWINCDKPKCLVIAGFPALIREHQGDAPQRRRDSAQIADCPPTRLEAHDVGKDLYGISYSFTGDLFDYKDKDREYPFCFDVPLSAYKKTYYFSDSTYIIKTPGKLKGKVTIAVAEGDTILTGAPYKNRKTQTRFQAPAHPWMIFFDTKPFGVLVKRNSELLKMRQKKGKKVVIIKVRRRAIREYSGAISF